MWLFLLISSGYIIFKFLDSFSYRFYFDSLLLLLYYFYIGMIFKRVVIQCIYFNFKNKCSYLPIYIIRLLDLYQV